MFEDWGEFYLVVGGAAAVLIGLIFVVITLMPRPPAVRGPGRIKIVHGADPSRQSASFWPLARRRWTRGWIPGLSRPSPP
jgi:hypothetical protein